MFKWGLSNFSTFLVEAGSIFSTFLGGLTAFPTLLGVGIKYVSNLGGGWEGCVKYDSTLAGGESCFQPWWRVGVKYVSNLAGGGR